MAFQNLRVGGKLYILHKDNNIRIEEAEVTNITMPTPSPPKSATSSERVKKPSLALTDTKQLSSNAMMLWQ